MIKIPKWTITEFCDYEPITTFWDDFSIAEAFGKSAIKDTYQRAFAEWNHNYKYLTELVMVLNHKIHQYYGVKNSIAELYYQLYREADIYAQDNLKGKELNYFYEITD